MFVWPLVSLGPPASIIMHASRMSSRIVYLNEISTENFFQRHIDVHDQISSAWHMPVSIVSRSSTKGKEITEETKRGNSIERYDDRGIPTWKMGRGMNPRRLAASDHLRRVCRRFSVCQDRRVPGEWIRETRARVRTQRTRGRTS